MTDRDLAYWLQGAFELGGLATIDEVSAGCILRHIALVRTITPESTFSAKIEIALLVASAEERSALIQKVVADMFEHVLDKEHPDQTVANEAHHGPGWSPFGGPVYRC